MPRSKRTTPPLSKNCLGFIEPSFRPADTKKGGPAVHRPSSCVRGRSQYPGVGGAGWGGGWPGGCCVPRTLGVGFPGCPAVHAASVARSTPAAQASFARFQAADRVTFIAMPPLCADRVQGRAPVTRRAARPIKETHDRHKNVTPASARKEERKEPAVSSGPLQNVRAVSG